jgi:beta-lactamase class A
VTGTADPAAPVTACCRNPDNVRKRSGARPCLPDAIQGAGFPGGNLVTVLAVSQVTYRTQVQGPGKTMNRSHAARRLAALALGLALSLVTATAAGAQAVTPAAPAAGAQALAGLRPQAASAAICTSASGKHRKLAARMSEGIAAALQGRSSVVSLASADTRTGVTCSLHTRRHFHSASIVKVIILGALLRHLMAENRDLSPDQVTLTTEMITESSNSAATTLWDELGRRHLQRFLNLAKMTRTTLGTDGFWGLTRVTAHDEMLLLKVLKGRHSILDKPSRSYALSLMANVIASQRWGVTAGAPADMTAHVKNGWLPDPVLWVINSIGVFTGPDRHYRIVVLTRDNPNMTYGVDTVQDVAEVINHDLNPGATDVVPASAPYPSWGTPDEQIPAR